jgi:prevent-host-death family protein
MVICLLAVALFQEKPLGSQGKGFVLRFDWMIGSITMYWMDVQDAKLHLLKLIHAVCNGEEVVIAKDGVPVARIVPYSKCEEQRAGATSSA